MHISTGLRSYSTRSCLHPLALPDPQVTSPSPSSSLGLGVDQGRCCLGLARSAYVPVCLCLSLANWCTAVGACLR